MKTLGAYRVGELEVQVARQALARNGDSVHLRAKTFEVLLYLLEHRERLVTKDELFGAVWESVAVSDSSLVQCIIELRKALGDDARNPRFIRTVSKAGYQFIGPVEEIAANGSERAVPDTAPEARSTGLRASPSVAMILGAVSLLTLGWWLLQPKTPTPALALAHNAGKFSVLVLYFENQSGNQELNWLKQGLADMLITNLSRSSEMNVLSRGELSSLLQRMRRPAAAPVPLEGAMLLAEKSRADAVVLGEFAKFGDKIRINVHLHNAQTGRLLASEDATAETPSNIISEMDLLCLKLRNHLGSHWNGRDRPAMLSTLMTDNLEAYHSYSQGLEKAQAFHTTEAIALFEKAIALDPRFAMAHARIGYTYAVKWDFPNRGKPYLERAFRLSDRLSERDRLYIAAWYAQANTDYSVATHKYREVIAAYPGDIEAYVALGALLVSSGRYEDAKEIFKQGIGVDREAAVLYDQLARPYVAEARYDEAIALERQSVAVSPNESNAFDSLGLVYLYAGRYAEAEQSYEQALRLKPDFDIAARHRAILYYRTGRYRDAIRAFQVHARIAPSNRERADSYANIAWCWKRRGDLPRAMDAFNRAIPDHLTKPADLVVRALWRGDLGEAEKSAALLNNEPGWTSRGGPRQVRRLHSYIRGEIFLANNEGEKAVAAFKEALQSAPGGADLDDFEDCLGDAYLRLGRVDEAVAEYERVLRLHPGAALARYHLGEVYASKGQRRNAEIEFRRFLDLWNRADSDLQEVRMANEFLASCTPRSY